MISIVVQPAAHSVAFRARCLRRLSCQLWVSLQARCRSRSLVCVGLQCCSQRAAWPLSAALSYLSRARPDSQPGLPRHKGGLVLGETGVSNPPPPPPRVRPGRCLLRRRSHIFEAEQLRKKGHLCHPFTVAISPETRAPSACESAHVRYGASTRGDRPSPRALQTGLRPD